MTTSRKQLKPENCLLEPLNQFGDHTKGYLGCIWCDLALDCVRFHPAIGVSVLFREDFRKAERLLFRLNLILKRSKDMSLNSDQKTFIRKKVSQLGTIAKVKAFYNKDCEVDTYANTVANKLFNKEGK